MACLSSLSTSSITACAMPFVTKKLRARMFPLNGSRPFWVNVPCTSHSATGLRDRPNFDFLGMDDDEVYQRAVLLFVDRSDGQQEEVVFLVCCTCDARPGHFNRSLFAIDHTILWPGRVAVFRVAQGSCSCALVNIHLDDEHLALQAVEM